MKQIELINDEKSKKKILHFNQIHSNIMTLLNNLVILLKQKYL